MVPPWKTGGATVVLNRKGWRERATLVSILATEFLYTVLYWRYVPLLSSTCRHRWKFICSIWSLRLGGGVLFFTLEPATNLKTLSYITYIGLRFYTIMNHGIKYYFCILRSYKVILYTFWKDKRMIKLLHARLTELTNYVILQFYYFNFKLEN
jgi:hypothetical protein